MKIRVGLLTLAFCISNLFGVIGEILDISKVREYLTSEPIENLVLLDIDLTLIKPIPHLSYNLFDVLYSDNTPSSYEELIYEMRDELMSEAGVLDYDDVKEEFGVFLLQSIEEAPQLEGQKNVTANFVKSLQEEAVEVVGLTSRSFAFREGTKQQLANVGIALGEREYFGSVKEFDLADINKTPIAHDEIGYSNGIIYCGCFPKADVLRAVLTYLDCGIMYRNYVFVDDNLNNIETVDSLMKNEFVANISSLHYQVLARSLYSQVEEQQKLNGLIQKLHELKEDFYKWRKITLKK